MANAVPPAKFAGTISTFVLPRGTCLWRVHTREREPWEFNPTAVDALFGGARFDATRDDEYPHYYAGLQEETALCEALLRDLHPDDHGTRLVPRAAVSDRYLSGLAVTEDLPLISLRSGTDLGAIGQDAWLVTAAGSQYAQTRGWAHWLRRQADWAFGLAWPSLRNLSGTAVVLFGDRCAAAFGPGYARTLLHHIPPLTVQLGDKDGADWLAERLRGFGIAVAPPGYGLPAAPEATVPGGVVASDISTAP